MAKMVLAKGVDVSTHQGKVNWEKVKASGIDYAILRCGFGDDVAAQDDEWYMHNATECERVGMPYGVYLFSYAKTVKQAKSEAAHTIRLLKGRKITWPVYYDLEDAKTTGTLSSTLIGDIVEAFCTAITKAGYKVGVYSYKNWMDTKLTDPRIKKWPLWLAQINNTVTYGGDYEMWQYSSTGKVSGVTGNVDMNYAYVNYNTVAPAPAAGSSKKTETKATDKVPDVTYRVRSNGKWLPAVVNLKDYAGIVGAPITDVAIKVSVGSIKYRVHAKDGKWLPYVTGYNTTDYNNGYAGIGKPIDAIQVIYTPAKGGKSRKAKYRISPVGKGYWPWQSNTDKDKKRGLDGYAGMYGTTIDRLEIVIE